MVTTETKIIAVIWQNFGQFLESRVKNIKKRKLLSFQVLRNTYFKWRI